MRFSFEEACAYISQKGLVVASSGNLSVRNDVGMDITTSGCWIEDPSWVNVDDNGKIKLVRSFYRGNPKPSSEWLMHSLIYKARGDVNAILHCQSPYATALSCSEDMRLKEPVIPEIPYYIKKYEWVESFRPGSQELADAVAETVTPSDVNVVLLKYHGQVVIGSDLRDVIQKALFFELACKINHARTN